ncbi:MAG: PD-(D/E)XK nuclease-like domain-containing protein [Oscillospiraceae bacterium]|nr:PD-(D/E)XK nuclease-like domain-containing protein [Oscillospiraceae bacterium]
MILTNENYYSPEANREYMSVSQYKQFKHCEAAGLAIVRGEWVPTSSSTALLVGSYVDAALTEDLEVFKASHPELYKRDGALKSDYVRAQEVVDRIQSDRLMTMLLGGNHQTILTGTIAGVPFKAKLDSLLSPAQAQAIMEEFPETASALSPFGTIVDLKCMRDLSSAWSDEDQERVSFIRHWGYDIQGAVYQALEGHRLPFVIAAATKEDPPDIRAISVGQYDLDARMDEVLEEAPRYQAIKEGRATPRRCESCAYCRATKKLTSIIDHKELLLSA